MSGAGCWRQANRPERMLFLGAAEVPPFSQDSKKLLLFGGLSPHSSFIPLLSFLVNSSGNG